MCNTDQFVCPLAEILAEQVGDTVLRHDIMYVSSGCYHPGTCESHLLVNYFSTLQINQALNLRVLTLDSDSVLFYALVPH